RRASAFLAAHRAAVQRLDGGRGRGIRAALSEMLRAAAGRDGAGDGVKNATADDADERRSKDVMAAIGAPTLIQPRRDRRFARVIPRAIHPATSHRGIAETTYAVIWRIAAY